MSMMRLILALSHSSASSVSNPTVTMVRTMDSSWLLSRYDHARYANNSLITNILIATTIGVLVFKCYYFCLSNTKSLNTFILTNIHIVFVNNMSEKMSKDEFLKKHKPLTDDEVKAKLREAKLRKEQYSKVMDEVEKNLLGYSDVEEPIVDPETDKVVAWMKLPSNMLLEEFFALTGGKTNTKDMSPEEVASIRNKEYELMSELITVPKKDMAWWRQHLNPRFAKLVRLKLLEFFEEIGGVAENF